MASNMNKQNKFVNDGSFLEMFKKKMAEANSETKLSDNDKKTEISTSGSDKKTNDVDSKDVRSTVKRTAGASEAGISTHLPIVGKRRRPKMLKTGMVAKKIKDEDKDDESKDTWSKYIDEVRKYKSQKCIEDEGGTPLVK